MYPSVRQITEWYISQFTCSGRSQSTFNQNNLVHISRKTEREREGFPINATAKMYTLPTIALTVGVRG